MVTDCSSSRLEAVTTATHGWFYNIVANPQVIVETGSETLPMRATVAEEPECSRLFKQRVAERAVFSEYEAQTSRVIPVVILSRESMSEG